MPTDSYGDDHPAIKKNGREQQENPSFRERALATKHATRDQILKLPKEVRIQLLTGLLKKAGTVDKLAEELDLSVGDVERYLDPLKEEQPPPPPPRELPTPEEEMRKLGSRAKELGDTLTSPGAIDVSSTEDDEEERTLGPAPEKVAQVPSNPPPEVPRHASKDEREDPYAENTHVISALNLEYPLENEQHARPEIEPFLQQACALAERAGKPFVLIGFANASVIFRVQKNGEGFSPEVVQIHETDDAEPPSVTSPRTLSAPPPLPVEKPIEELPTMEEELRVHGPTAEYLSNALRSPVQKGETRAEAQAALADAVGELDSLSERKKIFSKNPLAFAMVAMALARGKTYAYIANLLNEYGFVTAGMKAREFKPLTEDSIRYSLYETIGHNKKETLAHSDAKISELLALRGPGATFTVEEFSVLQELQSRFDREEAEHPIRAWNTDPIALAFISQALARSDTSLARITNILTEEGYTTNRGKPLTFLALRAFFVEYESDIRRFRYVNAKREDIKTFADVESLKHPITNEQEQDALTRMLAQVASPQFNPEDWSGESLSWAIIGAGLAGGRSTGELEYLLKKYVDSDITKGKLLGQLHRKIGSIEENRNRIMGVLERLQEEGQIPHISQNDIERAHAIVDEFVDEFGESRPGAPRRKKKKDQTPRGDDSEEFPSLDEETHVLGARAQEITDAFASRTQDRDTEGSSSEEQVGGEIGRQVFDRKNTMFDFIDARAPEDAWIRHRLPWEFLVELSSIPDEASFETAAKILRDTNEYVGTGETGPPISKDHLRGYLRTRAGNADFSNPALQAYLRKRRDALPPLSEKQKQQLERMLAPLRVRKPLDRRVRSQTPPRQPVVRPARQETSPTTPRTFSFEDPNRGVWEEDPFAWVVLGEARKAGLPLATSGALLRDMKFRNKNKDILLPSYLAKTLSERYGDMERDPRPFLARVEREARRLGTQKTEAETVARRIVEERVVMLRSQGAILWPPIGTSGVATSTPIGDERVIAQAVRSAEIRDRNSPDWPFEIRNPMRRGETKFAIPHRLPSGTSQNLPLSVRDYIKYYGDPARPEESLLEWRRQGLPKPRGFPSLEEAEEELRHSRR